MPHHVWVAYLLQREILISDRPEFDRTWLEPLSYAYISFGANLLISLLQRHASEVDSLRACLDKALG